MIALLIQVVVTLVVARLFGAAMRRIGQPSVIGEILAGIALGPSLFGAIAPAPGFKLLAGIGVLLFMVQVGFEFDARRLRGRGRAAIVISHASIVTPFILGILLAMTISRTPSFVAFMGVAMSITAFPVLARILQERGLTTTPLGVTAITCAAINDFFAWTLLAIVVMFARDHAIGFGIYGIFIAFAIGAAAPLSREKRRAAGVKINGITRWLLPLFFAYSGLRTHIGSAPWLLTIAIIVVATAGKLGGAALAARFCGSAWSEAVTLGVLLNTRGLMELVALNLGLDLGLLTPPLFSAMVLMAVTTTVATAPLLSLTFGSAAATAPHRVDAVPPATL